MASDKESELTAIVREFLLEAKENLDQFELALLELESDPAAERSLQAAFRSVHSIKGACGFLGFARIEAVTHAGETLLAQVREGRLRMNAEITNALLLMVDEIRRTLVSLEATGAEGEGDGAAAIAALKAATSTSGRPAPDHPPTPTATTRPEDLRALATADDKIRVDTLLLERLMNLVGELVLARNQILQFTAGTQASSVAAATQRLNLITTEIQEVAMKTRMQPIGNIWSRFPRLVRELARSCGKQARIEMDGQHTELDRSLIEAIQDPLTHLMRNAVDHGLERPGDRAQCGKPAEGLIALHAYHEGGLVNIEISDDGRGLDSAAIRQKAVRQGLLTSEQVERMTDRELWRVIFLPGFSTQETVSNLSGRGVGLDVVKTKIEHIGGTVDVQSRPGQGTTFKLKIPLTLAIIPALVVTDGGERYAIPQASLVEVLRLASGGPRQIERVQGTPVLRLRGKLLPVTFLGHELGRGESGATGDSTAIVVLQADDRSFGLVVDEINDTEEIVVKPLWKRLKGLTCYAGATVMGDGRVALILDALGLAQRVGVVEEAQGAQRQAKRVVTQAEERPAQAAEARDQVLLCGLGRGGRLAIPLSKVARLEELKLQQIERTGEVEVVQYREHILPLVRLGSVLKERRARPRGQEPEVAPGEALQVVVYASQERSFGLVVDQILDIVEVKIELQRTGARPGVLGSMVIHERVTEFLDVEGAIRLAHAGFLPPQVAPVGAHGEGP